MSTHVQSEYTKVVPDDWSQTSVIHGTRAGLYIQWSTSRSRVRNELVSNGVLKFRKPDQSRLKMKRRRRKRQKKTLRKKKKKVMLASPFSRFYPTVQTM